MYLTDRLPKPSYDSVTLIKKTTEDMERRSTEVEVEDEILASNGSLPELKKNAKSVPKVCNEKHK